MAITNRWKWWVGVFLALLAAGWAWLALADGNKTLGVKVVQEKQLQVAFPADYYSGAIKPTFHSQHRLR